MSRGLVLSEINAKRYENFFRVYKQIEILGCDLTRKTFIGNKVDTCRFCRKSTPQINFSADAHAIPQLLGNKYLFSWFECNDCNIKVFSNYETQLASFLGFYRTIARIRGKKYPKFINPRTGLKMIAENANSIKIEVFNDDELFIDKKNKTFKIFTNKESYIPINVFRILLKIGITLMPECLLDDYKTSLDFLLTDLGDKEYYFPFARLFNYFIPGPLPVSTFALLYQKTSDYLYKNYFSHCLVLFFPNHIYQIYLPYNRHDMQNFRNGMKINIPIYPCIIDSRVISKFGKTNFKIHDLCSNQKRKSELDSIEVSYEDSDHSILFKDT